MATKEDANILLRISEQWNASEMRAARSWYAREISSQDVRSIEEFRRRAPEGSVEERYAHDIAGAIELAGVLVKHDLLDEDLFFDAYGIEFFWDGLEKWVRESRRQQGSDSLYENFEWLANRSRRWDEAHQVDTSGERKVGEKEAAARGPSTPVAR